MTSTKGSFILAVCMATLVMGLGYAGFASAKNAANGNAIVKYRQAVMKAQGAHMAATAAIIKGKVDYKDQLAGHVNALEATTRDIGGLFPPGSDVGKTKALKAVWTKHAEFEKHAKKAADMASAFAKAVAEGDTQSYGKHFKNLVDACKGCHEDFRKKPK